MSIESSIYDRLNDATVTGYVADRIYVSDPAQNTSWPFLTYTVTDSAPVTSMAGGTALSLYTVEVDLWARSLSQLTGLANAVRARLHQYRGGDIQRAALTDQGDEQLGDETEGDIAHGHQTYQVWAAPANIQAAPDNTGVIRTGPNTVSLTTCNQTLTLDCSGLSLNGQPVTSGDLSYTHTQGTPATVWTINHNLQKHPSITVVDSGGTVVLGNIQHVSPTQATVTFGVAFGGKAYAN